MKLPGWWKRSSFKARVLASALPAAAILFLWWIMRPVDDGMDQHSWFTVSEGPLTISVSESGTVKPSEQIVITSELEGRSTILYLIEEGTEVEAGDLLVELDASNLQDNLIDQQIRVQNTEAAFIRSRENLEVVRNQAESDIAEAELSLRFAREDLVQYREGEYPNRQRELEARITLAREDLQRAEEKLKWSLVLFEEQYLAESELRADELSVRKSQLEVSLAENNLSLLEDFTYHRRVDQLESDIQQSELALERVRRRTAADLVQAEADLRAKQSEFERETDRLARLEEQIAKARIEAPRAGLVVYATSAQFSRRGTQEPLAEGQEVRERQELIHLPTASTFLAEIQVHESSLDKIRTGLPVKIRADALPGREFDGRVSYIAPLPDPTSVFLNPDLKVYRTEVRIDGGANALRTGMSCEAEIVIEEFDEALFVPIQSVVRVAGRPTVYVRDGSSIRPQPVTIGLDNNRMVHVLSGLEEGMEVMLAPPLEDAERLRRTVPETSAQDDETPLGGPEGIDTQTAPGADRPRSAPAGAGRRNQREQP